MPVLFACTQQGNVLQKPPLAAELKLTE